MVTERDDYKMPPLFTGEYTTEILEEKRKYKIKAEKKMKELKKIYEERKKVAVRG